MYTLLSMKMKVHQTNKNNAYVGLEPDKETAQN